MIIGIDIRVLAKGTKTGIEEYTTNLLSFLLPIDKKIKYKLFYNAFRKVKLDYSWLELSNVELKESKWPNRLLDFFSQIFRYPKIDRFLGKIDIFFSPHFLPISLPRGCKRVVTFHDLSFKHHSQFFSFSRKLWHLLTFPKLQARNAKKIIVDSLSTKEDLIKIYKINPDKIKVIYLGTNKIFEPIKKNDPQLLKVKRKYILPISLINASKRPALHSLKTNNNEQINISSSNVKFILYFGTIEPRKNLLSIIKAFEALKEKIAKPDLETKWDGLEGTVIGKKGSLLEDLKLVIAGSKGWLYKDIFKMAENSKFKKDIIFTGIIDDKDKPYLYNLASAFIYPSFFEGFGFPPLEAMACGIPTIVSNTSSLPEVVGDGAIMVDPSNVNELVFAVKEILENKSLREDLIKKGLKQAKKFDWDRTAKEVLKIFREL